MDDNKKQRIDMTRVPASLLKAVMKREIDSISDDDFVEYNVSWVKFEGCKTAVKTINIEIHKEKQMEVQ